MICRASALPAALRSTKRRKPSASSLQPSSVSDRTVNCESRIQLKR
jgi:hypothetical protein